MGLHCSMLPFVTLPAPQEGTIVKHVKSEWVKLPIITFTGVVGFSGHFEETVIQ